jgi:non-ribosomal peptide synthetase component F
MSLELPPELWATLTALSVGRGSSLSALVLSAFEVLLYRYTGQDDLILGACIDDPHLHLSESRVDSNGSLLLLRTDLSGNPDFLTQLDRTREVVVRAVEDGGLPLEILPELLSSKDDALRQPLFQVMFMYQETTAAQPSPSTSLTPAALKDTAALAGSELILWLVRHEAEVSGTLEYNSGLFDAETVAAMLQHFHTLLHGIASTPEQTLFDLPLLGESLDADDAPTQKLDDISDREDQFVF